MLQAFPDGAKEKSRQPEVRGQRSEVRWQRSAGEGRTGSHEKEVAQKVTKRTKAGTEAEEFNAKARRKPEGAKGAKAAKS
jgi:hypothetical protein